MKYPLFARMGDKYPKHLEARYERILIKIEELWQTPEIHDYFSDLLIDRRGGRQGFPPDVLSDIIALREFRELETFREAEQGEDAARELRNRGIRLEPGDFFEAIEAGDQHRVDLFVRARFNVNQPYLDGTPPLVAALKKGYTVIAKILLNAGANVNAHDRLGLTPLLITCGKTTQGFKWMAEALIRREALVNVRDALGNTPLILALSGGNFDIAQLLIANGADVSPLTRRGENALSIASALPGPEAEALTLLLRERGARLPDAT